MSAALDTMSAEDLAELRQMQEADTALEPSLPPIDDSPPVDAAPEAERAREEPVPTPEPQKVDKRALDEERERRREAVRKLAEVERKAAADQARVEERLRLLADAAQQHFQPPPVVETPAPDFNADPAGFIQHGFKSIQAEMQRLAAQQAALKEESARYTREQQEAAKVQELANWGTAQEHEFAQETPDYLQAVEYLRGAREKLIRTMGVTDPVEIRDNVRRDVQGLAMMARERGQQFGKVLYELAKAHGYQQAPAAVPVAAAAPASSASPYTADNAAERLVRGQDMATTLGSVGGAPRGEPAGQHIANMSDAEFDAYYAKVQKQGPAALRALFGQ